MPSQSPAKLLLFASVAFLTSTLPVFAHHSFAAEYDESKPVKVTGVVTKVEWLNPHIWFYVDVKDDSGKVVNWAFSGGAPGQLMRRRLLDYLHAQGEEEVTRHSA